MWTVIAIEGIDRIGKSTFIEELKKNVEKFGHDVSIEKPTIGINTLKKIGYPLQDIPHIMEIRNIGLFEETLFQAQQNFSTKPRLIIRDRFNLSELAYGIAYRPGSFGELFPSEKEPFLLYRKWNDWFEEEFDKVTNTFLITFVLDKESYPNEDEAISASSLVKVNEAFCELAEASHFKKKITIELHKDPKTGMTNIMDKMNEVMSFLTNYSWVTPEYGPLLWNVKTMNPNTFVIQLDGDIIPIAEEVSRTECQFLNKVPVIETAVLYRYVEKYYNDIKKQFYGMSYQARKNGIQEFLYDKIFDDGQLKV